ncbi:MAG: hypothetical protein Ct9H300mP1_38630 [Planctomycetaceae bacterium]|nr:MAG: hypothetical protein Ct9H300mP1_38630 [Planctomycetaceae bacterium]
MGLQRVFRVGNPAPCRPRDSTASRALKPLARKLLIMRNFDQVRCDEKGINAHYDGAPAPYGRASRR